MRRPIVLLTDCPSSMSRNAELSLSLSLSVYLSDARICVTCILYLCKLEWWWLHVTTITHLKPERFHLHTNSIRVQFIKNLTEIWLLLSFVWLQIYCELSCCHFFFLFCCHFHNQSTFRLFWRIWPSILAEQHFQVFPLLPPVGFIQIAKKNKSPNKLHLESPLFKLP